MGIWKLPFGKRKLDNEPGGMRNIYGNKENDAITRASENYFGDAGDTIRHSRHYHRYYEGYTEVRTPNPKNKFVPYKIERVYTAPYTVADMERSAYLRHMVFYGLLTAAAIFLYISAFTDRAVSMNASRQFGAAAVMVTLVPLVLLTASLIAYYLRPKKMKSYDYRTTTRNLKASAIAAAAGFLAAAALLGVYLCAAGSADPASELLYAARLLLAAAACFAVYRLERRMPYRQEPNNVKLPKGEYHRIQ